MGIFKVAKMVFGQIDLFDFTSFFGLDFFKFSGSLCIYKHQPLLVGKEEENLSIKMFEACLS